jgi:hypothetical protein
MVVAALADDLGEDVDGFVRLVGEAGAGAAAGGAFGGVEMGADLGRFQSIEEGAEGEVGEVGGVDEAAVDAEHGDDDVGLVGGEGREVLEAGGHEARVVVRASDASADRRMSRKLRANVVGRGKKVDVRGRGSKRRHSVTSRRM